MLLQIKCPARKAGIETFQIICVLKRLDLAKRCWWWFWLRWCGEWWEVWLWSVLIAPLAILYESPHNNFSMTLINHHFDFQIVTDFDIISKLALYQPLLHWSALLQALYYLTPPLHIFCRRACCITAVSMKQCLILEVSGRLGWVPGNWDLTTQSWK